MPVNFTELQEDPEFQALLEIDPDTAIDFVDSLLKTVDSVPTAPAVDQDRIQKTLDTYNAPLSNELITDLTVAGLNAPPEPHKPTAWGDFTGGVKNALSGFTRDDLVKQSGGGFASGLGTVVGSLTDVGAAALLGGAAGSIIPWAGTAGGALGGLISGGTAVGSLQEAQRERLAGEEYNPLKILGAGAVGGLSSLPVGGAGATVLRTIAKNAAIDSAINAAGDIALQGVEQGTLTPDLDLGRVGVAAGIGAGTGAVAGGIHAKGKPRLSVEEQAAQSVAEYKARNPEFIRNNQLSDGQTVEIPEGYAQQKQLEALDQQLTRERQQIDLAQNDAEHTQSLNRIRQLEQQRQQLEPQQNPQRGTGVVDLGQKPESVDIITPKRTNPADEILGGSRIEQTEGGIDLALRDTSPAVREDAPPPRNLLDAYGRSLTDNRVDTQLLDARGRSLTDSVDLTPQRVQEQAPPPLDSEPQIYSQGQDLKAVEEQVRQALSKDEQIIDIARVEQHFKGDEPRLGHIKNVLQAAKDSQSVLLEMKPREAPAEIRTREFLPMAFSLQPIKAATERRYLRNLLGTDQEVINHLISRINKEGGTVDSSYKVRASGKGYKESEQIRNLINQLDEVMGGRYLKSPRIFGLNIGESSRGGQDVNRLVGYRLDSIQKSSLTGNAPTPETIQGFEGSQHYKNSVKGVFDTLETLKSHPTAGKVVDRYTQQVLSGRITSRTMRDIEQMIGNDVEALVAFCKNMGLG